MRILNRPMFRYGGPIKEGVMHGMRNNYQSGQLVRPGPGRPGYKGFPGVTGGYDTAYNVKNVKSNIDAATKAGKVKTLLNKSKSFLKKPLWSERGINYLLNRKIPQWAKGTARTIGGLATGFGSRMPKASLIGSRAAPYYAMWKASEVTPVDEKYGITRKENLLAPFYRGERAKENIEKKFLRDREQASNPNNWWRYDPGRYGPRKDHPDYDPSKIRWNPWSKDTGAADTPIRYDSEGNIIRFNPVSKHFGLTELPATGSVEDIASTTPKETTSRWDDTDPIITAEMRDKIAKDAQNKRLKSYLDMMGYDSAKKTAMSDALIDASALVQDATTEAGSIKHADWGNLINKAIQTTSKRLDKPAQIREAVGLMMTKGAIEKDIADAKGTASEQAIDALSDASGRSKKYVANAKLGIANTAAEAKANLVKIKKGSISSDDVVAVTMQFAEENGIPFKRHITTEEKNEQIGKGKKYPTIVKMLEALNLDSAGTDDGLYVVGTSIVEVEDGVPKLRG